MLAAFLALGVYLHVPAAGFPFEKTAEAFLSSHGLAGKSASEADFESVLGKHFLIANVGVFDVRFPVADLEKRAGELTKCAKALIDSQEHLLDWLKPAGVDQKAAREDLKAVQKWIAGLREAQLAKLKEPAGKDWMESLQCPDATKAAQKRLALALGDGTLFSAKRDVPEVVRLVLTPGRKEFVELVCYAGWQNEADRGLYWADGVTTWT